MSEILKNVKAVALGEAVSWRDLSDDSMRRLFAGSHTQRYKRGERIDIELGLVVNGVAALEITLADGRRSIVELFHRGDLIDFRGEARPRRGKVNALIAADIAALSPSVLDDCIGAETAISRAVDGQLSDQTGRRREHIADLAVKTPIEKMASALFELSRWPGVREEEGRLHLPLLRKDIADYLGVKPETVSRTLRRLLTAGLIQTDPKDGALVELIDLDTLKLIANGDAARTFEVAC